MAAVPESPPLVRERLIKCSVMETVRRITPAHAGKTLLIAAIVHVFPDHPRSCGKDINRQSSIISP